MSLSAVGICFEPDVYLNVKNGTIDFGGHDPTKYIGELTELPITTQQPASKYWGLNQIVTYGKNGPVLIDQSMCGILDTGTTLILLPTEQFKMYQGLTGATMDP